MIIKIKSQCGMILLSVRLFQTDFCEPLVPWLDGVVLVVVCVLVLELQSCPDAIARAGHLSCSITGPPYVEQLGLGLHGDCRIGKGLFDCNWVCEGYVGLCLPGLVVTSPPVAILFIYQ